MRFSSPWLSVLNRPESRGHEMRLRLFCFPHAGATPSLFHTRWAKFLPPQVEVVGIHYPGRTSRLDETPIRSIPALISQLIQAISPLFTTDDYLPYVTYGNSMGAICAYEFTRRVRNEGYNEALTLIVSSCLPPQICGADDPVCDLPDDELQRVLQFRFGYPILTDPEIIKLTFPSLRADLAAIDHYSSAPFSDNDCPLSCPIHTLVGAKDKMVTLDTQPQWNLHTTSSLTTNPIPGVGHFVYDSPTFQNIVRRILSENLDDIEERPALSQFKVTQARNQLKGPSSAHSENKTSAEEVPINVPRKSSSTIKKKSKKIEPSDLEISYDFC
ncbi:putative Gramicidin S biosynthesis protein GrsT [Blattamonas nauphoetae]|uniref:Gramicidin S biosynthesis protein GrsT n=1 Tax=Blattamonas nauphoetae TaxID=2049346 RepID=A0ABQ9XHJ7_9EUKA|nr:putative Gramicidin S biosynthesis protein GrsT [Blattamonas nauphoetae]